MTIVLASAVAFAAAWLATLILTPLVARMATRWGAAEMPDSRYDDQRGPVPSGGGLAVALAVSLAVAAAGLLVIPGDDAPEAWLLRGLVPASLVLLVVGIVADVRSMTGIYKLIGQLLAVTLFVAGGSKFSVLSLFGWEFPLGNLDIPFTIFFCLAAINAFHLLDAADGLAASIGAVVCMTLGIITAARGGAESALVCFALAGALVAFLRYDWPPASVHLGNTGSMLIGLVVAAVAIHSSIKQQTAFALAVPLAICAIPILDAAAALVRRITTGQRVFGRDRGHLHHAFALRGWSMGQTVAFITGLAILTCGGALASYFTGHDLFAFAVSGAVIVALAATRVFGHTEAALLTSRARSLARRFVPQSVRRRLPAAQSAIRLRGARKWQKLWAALCEAAPRYQVAGLTLHINIPNLNEAFYAQWRQSEPPANGEVWRFHLPLMREQQIIGKLSVLGAAGDRQAMVDLQQLLEFLESLDQEIAEILADTEVITRALGARR